MAKIPAIDDPRAPPLHPEIHPVKSVLPTAFLALAAFTGPLLSDVLKLVGANGSAVELHTLDDYTVTVPASDAQRYGAILAYSMNGKRLKVRDFGPLFLIYPRDAYPSELTGAAADGKAGAGSRVKHHCAQRDSSHGRCQRSASEGKRSDHPGLQLVVWILNRHFYRIHTALWICRRRNAGDAMVTIDPSSPRSACSHS